MLTCVTVGCSEKGVEHTKPVEGDLFCGVCGQVMAEVTAS